MKIESLKNFESKQKGQALIYKDLPNEDYHASVGISSSYVRRFGQSQLHAVNYTSESTPALKFGTAAHSLLVEGQEAFDKEVRVLTGSPYTKAYKEEKAEYEEQGFIVLKEDEAEIITGMKENMIYEGNAYLNAKGKIPEASIYYKTTQSCEPHAFNYSVKKYGYDMQAAYYRRGVEMAGYEVTDFLFIAQEKVHPYASKVFRITKEQMDYGWTMMEQYLNDYKKYQKGKPLSIYNSPNVVDLVL
jgi:hypothetical protein